MTHSLDKASSQQMCFTYLRFERGIREQGIDRAALPYASKMNYKALAAKWALAWITLVLL